MLTLEMINAAPQHHVQQDRSNAWESTLSELLLVRRQVLLSEIYLESVKAERQICFNLRRHRKRLVNLYAQLLSQAAQTFGPEVLTQIEEELNIPITTSLDS
jgi:hypothetical protein